MLEQSRHSCGVPYELAADPHQLWDVTEFVCYACRAVELMKRKVQRDHESQKPKPGIPHPLDGRELHVEPYYQ